ncbi:hypothetical protein JNW91_03885 [Micromonospora sp. STR1_7]|uniref:PH domain-containing protein n=1 Tax=Micromonospora parastrephiae TaxID=2806101 RepID=A0ABS1XPA9_9ACTN|nr:hypothetical protein [Micromonospora parastrephiae]MBM0231090.1 hypothetical protein [Micromonospora parastrephiae]
MTTVIATSWIPTRFGRLIGYSLVIVAVAVPLAITQLTKAMRGGSAESYEIHEHGLAHVRRGDRRAWTWEQVYGVVVIEKGGIAWFGWDFGCLVSLNDGVRLQFNGLTRDARAMAGTLKSRCPQAVGKRHDPRWQAIFLWLAPVLAVAFGWTIWWAVDLIRTNDAQSDSLSPGYVKGVDPLSDGAIGGLSLLIVACALGGIAATFASIGLIAARIRSR